MKKLLFMIFFIPQVQYAQYWNSRTTEQNFENSDVFFKNHFMNPYGMLNFRDAAVGLIDDPYLNLSQNPANLPKGDKKFSFYLDFRGDRKIIPVVVSYPIIYCDYARSYTPDPRLLSQSRQEPEPVFSFGVLSYPFEGALKNLFIGATYQYVHRQDKFYTMQYWIYNYSPYYNAYGAKVSNESDIAIEDKFNKKDEMLTDGNYLAVYTGYKFSEKLTAGISLNGVSNKREGGYLYLYKYDDVLGQYKQLSQNSRERNQKYDHIAVNAGLNYLPGSGRSAGISGGFLKGRAEQDYTEKSSYTYDSKSGSQNFSNHMSDYLSTQNWKHDGKSYYLGVNISEIIGENKTARAYYRYTHEKTDLSNSSALRDTSKFDYAWQSGAYTSESHGYSSSFDRRSGAGSKTTNTHEGALDFLLKINDMTEIMTGMYYRKSEYTTSVTEPVLADRISKYYYNYQNQPSDNYNRTREDKDLLWYYNSVEKSLQIPVMIHFKINETFGLMLGFNRVLSDWEITDVTTAIFRSKREVNNSSDVTKTGFGERYTEAPVKITENKTDFITKLDVNVSDEFKVNLMLNPDFENRFSVTQWWLSFQAGF